MLKQRADIHPALAAHWRAIEKTYGYSKFSRYLLGGLVILYLIFTFWGVFEREAFNPVKEFLAVIMFTCFFVDRSCYQVKISPLGISVRYGWEETFVPWQGIQSIQVDSKKNFLRLYRDPDFSLDIDFQTFGYDELWETLRAKRPDLFTPLVIRKFRGANLSPTFLGSVFCIFVGAFGMSGLNASAKDFMITGPVFILLGLGGLMVELCTVRSIELGTTDLIIQYPFTKKRIPVMDILKIEQGKGLVTQASKLVSLGKVKEGQVAFYDNLLAWWRNHRGHNPKSA